MGTKTLLSECFLNRGFTLLQWLLNLVLQIPHFTLNINGQSNTVPKLVSPHDYMHDYLHLPFFSPTYDFFLSHQLYTTASLYSHSYLFSGQKHMRQNYDLVWQMNHRVKTKALYSLVDISMPRCLARPAVTPQLSSDSLLTERLFLIAQASLSVFSSFSARRDGRSHIIYSACHAKGISAVLTARPAALMCSSYQNIWSEWAMTPSLSCIKCPT